MRRRRRNCARMPKTTKTPKTKPPAVSVPQQVKLTTYDAACQALEHAREFAGHYGHIQQLAEAMTATTGERITRQMVGRWLAEDPAKRQQPGLGNGLVLLLCVERLKIGDAGGRPVPYESGQVEYEIITALRAVCADQKKNRKPKKTTK